MMLLLEISGSLCQRWNLVFTKEAGADDEEEEEEDEWRSELRQSGTDQIIAGRKPAQSCGSLK